MILPDFILTTRQNQLWKDSGMDSLERCRNKDYFKSYPYAVEYNYNSRGYRDCEWPNDITELKKCIWCVGDSFTVGLGSPLEHTWVNILQQRTGIRCINVSMDGASNDWMVRKINRILEEINPQRLVVQWSYFHRGEDPKSNLTDEDRRIWVCKNNMSYSEQLTNFKNIQSNIKNSTTQIVQSCIPNNQPASIHNQYKKMINKLKGISWPDLINITIDEFYFIKPEVKKELEEFGVLDMILEYLNTKQLLTDKNILSDISQTCIIVDQIDFARDGHHYDYLTAGKFVDSVINRFNLSFS